MQTGPLYVSPSGSDAAAGSFDAPLASLTEALRRLCGKTSPEAPGEILLFGGHYRMRETICVPEDNSFLSIRAVPGEVPVLTGSAPLAVERFIPVAQAEGPQFAAKVRIPEAVKPHVFAYDLGAEGIPVGSIQKNGFNWPLTSCYPELICDGALQTLAQWPNDRDLTRDDLLAGWDKPFRVERYSDKARADFDAALAHGARQGAIPRDFFFDKCDPPRTYAEMLAMDGPRLYCLSDALAAKAATWVGDPEAHGVDDGKAYEPDGWLCGYFGNNYASDMTPITGFDRTNRLLHLGQPVMYGVADKWLSVRARNLLCELDAPGEYYIDRSDGHNVLYYYPEGGVLADRQSELKSFGAEGLRLEGARGVTISSLTLTGGTGNAIAMLDCEDCEIKNCDIFNFSLDAVRIGRNNGAITTDPNYATSHGGHRNRVTACSIHDMGGGGVYAAGGDPKTLERGNHVVSRCEFENLSLLRTYTPAVYLEGVGNSAQANYIHNCPHMVIQIMGNDMFVAYNRIENVCLRASDQGAIHAGRCWTWLGNVITGNIIRHVKATDNHGVYLDDGMSGAIIRRNYFEDISDACVFSNSGYGHIIEDNIFVTDANAVRAWSYPFERPIGNERVLKRRYDDALTPGDGGPGSNMPTNIERWYAHYERDYPYLRKLYFPEDAQAHPDDENCIFRPAHSRYRRNVIVGKGWLHDGGDGFTRYYGGNFGAPLYTADSSGALGLDAASYTLPASSPIAADPAFGPAWIEAWNAAMRGQ